MPIAKLTSKFVRAVREPGDYRDVELKGFMLRVPRNGVASYRYEYREGKGRGARRRIETIGKATELQPETARDRARKLAGEIRQGETPIALRKAHATRQRVSELFPGFITHIEQGGRSAKTVKDYSQQYHLRIRPAFGDTYLSDITRTEIARWMDSHSNRPRSANYALSIFSSFLSYCAERGYLEGLNPCRGVKKFKQKSRDASFTREELHEFTAALKNYGDPVLEAAFWLLISTGARGKEVLSAEWHEVDLPDTGHGLWRIPANKMKQGRPHDYVLSEAITAKLGGYREAQRDKPSQWVFPGKIPDRPRHELRHAFYRIEKLAGIKHQTGRAVHGFRHTFLSLLADEGVSAFELMAWSGHSSIQAATGYVRRSRSSRVSDAGMELSEGLLARR